MIEKGKEFGFYNQIYFPVYLCSKEIMGMYNNLLKEVNLTYTQYIVMLYFWEVGSSDLKTISKALMLDPSTLTPLLKKLEQKGFIVRNRSVSDERKLMITLTEEGIRLKERAMCVPQKMIARFNLTEDEVNTLNAISSKVIKIIRKCEEYD